MTGAEPQIELRWDDYTLSRDQEDLRQVLRRFFSVNSPSERVRAAEAAGIDEALWRAAVDAGVVGLSLPDDVGGQSAGLAELVLAAEEAGRVLAPIPLADHAVAARLLASADAGHALLRPAAAGDVFLAIAPLSAEQRGPQLVPGGAVAHAVLMLVDANLLLLRRPQPPAIAANQAAAPLAWWAPDDPATDAELIARGRAARDWWTMAIGEWRVATASALAGLAAGACELARAYSLERGAFGAPIATYQAISHTLVELHMAVEAARNLTWRAAWYHAHEPGTRPELPAMALSNAIRTATDVTASSVHIHGGFGVTLEADVSLYHRRAGVWGRVAGGQRLLERAAETALDRIVVSRRAASASGARLNGFSAALRPAIPVEPS